MGTGKRAQALMMFCLVNKQVVLTFLSFTN